MSKNVFLLMVVFAVSVVCADYTFVIEDGDNIVGMSLDDNESLLMTGGQLYHLTLNDYSTARIEGTDPLISEYNGGIWLLRIGAYNHLEFLGGEVHRFAIGSDSRAVFSGGRIDQIYSQQNVGMRLVDGSDPPVYVPDPHITIDCRGWEHDIDTNILTGTWFDFTTFEIQLIDVAGYDPAIENIQFIPEPMSLILMGIGAIALRRRRV